MSILLDLFVLKDAIALSCLNLEVGNYSYLLSTANVRQKLKADGTNKWFPTEHLAKPKSFSSLPCFCLSQKKLGRLNACVAYAFYET